VTIPFVSGYKTIWTTLGIVSGWVLVVLGLSYYARKRIGVRRWRTLHRFTALAWVLGVAHSLGEGTDAGQVWFLAMTAVVAVPALLLLVGRLTAGPKPKPA
jgi:sulfoxide reductase heme-binding subunit YedZ